MSTLFDYLSVQTETFDERPFCPLDSAVFSQLIMVDMEGIVTPPPSPSADILIRLAHVVAPKANPVRIADLAAAATEDARFTGLVPHDIKRCLVAAGESPRFRDVELRYYRSVFDDAAGVMNRSIVDAGGDVLVVSQFTLMASTHKGNRPSYIRAAAPQVAVPLYEAFVRELELKLGRRVPTGVFGAHMQVSLVNDGPVTIWMDSKRRE